MSRILVVEDEDHIAQGLRFNLEADGHQVDVDGDGDHALTRLLGDGTTYAAVILDVMLPGRDGFSVVRALREAGEFVPVLMLTARGRPEDVLKGFESGADDYLPKPFELAILLARVRGLLRRSRWAREEPREADASHLLAFRGVVIEKHESFQAKTKRLGHCQNADRLAFPIDPKQRYIALAQPHLGMAPESFQRNLLSIFRRDA